MAAGFKLTELGLDGRKRSQAARGAPMTQRVHPILLAASLVPQTLNNSAARWQASITTLACSYSLHRLKRPTVLFFLTTPNLLQSEKLQELRAGA